VAFNLVQHLFLSCLLTSLISLISLFNLSLLCEALRSLRSLRLCGECLRHPSNHYTIKVIAARARIHWATGAFCLEASATNSNTGNPSSAVAVKKWL
jgi:hypothetical protein